MCTVNVWIRMKGLSFTIKLTSYQEGMVWPRAVCLSSIDRVTTCSHGKEGHNNRGWVVDLPIIFTRRSNVLCPIPTSLHIQAVVAPIRII